MFGFLTAPSCKAVSSVAKTSGSCGHKLSNVYNSTFCGLASSLDTHYGYASRILANRDSTLLSLVSLSQSPSAPSIMSRTCCNPIGKPKKMLSVNDPHLRYAASVTVCAAATKLEDDALDEGGIRGRVSSYARGWFDQKYTSTATEYLRSIHFPVEQVQSALTKQSRIEANINNIMNSSSSSSSSLSSRIESLSSLGIPPLTTNSPGSSSLVSSPNNDITRILFDTSSSATAESYATIFGHTATISGSESSNLPWLRNIGYHVGRSIYLLDAFTDYIDDAKRNKFNPLRIAIQHNMSPPSPSSLPSSSTSFSSSLELPSSWYPTLSSTGHLHDDSTLSLPSSDVGLASSSLRASKSKFGVNDPLLLRLQRLLVPMIAESSLLTQVGLHRLELHRNHALLDLILRNGIQQKAARILQLPVSNIVNEDNTPVYILLSSSSEAKENRKGGLDANNGNSESGQGDGDPKNKNSKKKQFRLSLKYDPQQRGIVATSTSYRTNETKVRRFGPKLKSPPSPPAGGQGSSSITKGLVDDAVAGAGFGVASELVSQAIASSSSSSSSTNSGPPPSSDKNDKQEDNSCCDNCVCDCCGDCCAQGACDCSCGACEGCCCACDCSC